MEKPNMIPTCSNCRFYVVSSGDDLNECRRHAPAPREMSAKLLWPVVKATEWCGEYERKGAK